MSSVEADFDRLALLDDEGWTSNNHYHDSLLQHVHQNCENALEIGCGTGAFARRVSPALRLIHNGRLQPPAEVRKAWEQHGIHDHYLTISQVRALADEILPGSSVKRVLLWRYMLVYQKPG